MSTLLERIRIIRNEYHYTQEFMAYELGISQTAYSHFENNSEDVLTIGRLRKLAAIFDMSFIDLITISLPDQIGSTSVLQNPQIGHATGIAFSAIKVTTIGSRIRYLREKKGLCQADIASQMGISQKTYSLLESSDDDSQKIGRLKSVAGCLSLTHWTELLLPDQLVLIRAISGNQPTGELSTILLSSTDEGLHQRVKEIEKLVIRLFQSTVNESVCVK